MATGDVLISLAGGGDVPDDALSVETEFTELSSPVAAEQAVIRELYERNRIKAVAPPLADGLMYHVFFLCHGNDRYWVNNVINKLEMPKFGFKCCTLERDFNITTLPVSTNVHFAIKNALKTVIILTPDFTSTIWYNSDIQLLSEADILLIQNDTVLVLLQDCEIPSSLNELVTVDVERCEDWWRLLVSQLCRTEESDLQADDFIVSPLSPVAPAIQRLRSGQLLASVRSRCTCTGAEWVDPEDSPDELIQHGVIIPPAEYSCAISLLTSQPMSRCHVVCYNMPLAGALFTCLLVLCLTLLPHLEARYLYQSRETGLELVHGSIVWLVLLTAYMLVTHVVRSRMKKSTHQVLAKVNNTFLAHDILVGVENLGIADCNKYYVHFFYYQLGPCLAYIQEFLTSQDENTLCFTNTTNMNNTPDADPAQVVEIHPADVTDTDKQHAEHITDDVTHMLANSKQTNESVQSKARALLLERCGEYTSQLITKRLGRPQQRRHVRDTHCLCQFVEQKVYKVVV